MNFRKATRALLLIAPLVGGCAGFWQNPNTTGTSSGCTSNCTTLSSGDFYLLVNGTTPQVQGEQIVSGKLTAISGSPWKLSATPYSMAISPSGNYLYVSTTEGVYVFPISSGGLGTGTLIDSADLTAYAIRVDGSWLIEAVQETGEVMFNAVPLNTSTGGVNGTIETAGFIATANLPSVVSGQMALSPVGANGDNTVFVALGTGGTIYFPFDPSTPANGDPFGSSASAPVIPVANSGASALSVAVDPGGSLVYIGETLLNSTSNPGGIRALVLSTLPALTNASGSPIDSGGVAPNFILPVGSASSGSGYIYVANGEGSGSTGNITSFAVTSASSTYSIAKGSTVAAGIQPLALAEDSNGDFIFAINSDGDPYFSSYTFDSTSAGKLDAQITASTGAAPVAMVAAP